MQCRLRISLNMSSAGTCLARPFTIRCLLQALMHWSGKLMPSVFRGWARAVAHSQDRRTAFGIAGESYNAHLLRRAVLYWLTGVKARLAQQQLLRHAVARLAGAKLFLRFSSWCAAIGLASWQFAVLLRDLQTGRQALGSARRPE